MTLLLVIVFCHFGEPVECHVERLVPESQVPIGCLAEGQERAAAWIEDHPGWSLVRPICEINVAPQRPS